MDKRRIIISVMAIFLFLLVSYVHAPGVTICGVDYPCSPTNDNNGAHVCPETYDASCRLPNCDYDCYQDGKYGSGTFCNANSDCPDYCSGNVRNYGRTCTYNCLCTSPSTENCDAYDGWHDTSGWYCNGICQRYKTQEYRDYYCRPSDATCQYTVTGTQNYYENAPYGQHCSGGTWTASGYCGSSGPSCNGDSQYQVTRYECDGSNSCNVYDYKDSYNCGTPYNTCPNICTARYTYTCSGGSCGTYTSDSYPTWNQVCSAGSIVGGSCGTDGCVNDYYYRDYGCSSGTCTYTDDDCRDCSCSCGNYNTNEANFCTDGRDNNCNGLTDRMDPACGVSISQPIIAPDYVDQSQSFTVQCYSSVGPVNCISATIGGRACTWTSWNGNYVVFSCTATSSCPTAETARCYVDTSKCAALSPTESTKSISVRCSGCGTYGSSTSCNADSRCTWCEQCYSTKYTGAGARCVAAGTCSSYCWNGQCTATCDNTQGGCTATTQCSGTIYQTRSWTCLDSCSCSYGSWVSGTCAQSKASCSAECATSGDCTPTTRCNVNIYETRTNSCTGSCACSYGSWTPGTCAQSKASCSAQCGSETDCTAALTQCSGTTYQTRTRSCTGSCTCSYSTWVSGTCAQSKASCSAQCGSASDCPSSCSSDQKYLYSSATCGANCACSYTTSDCTTGFPKCVGTIKQYNPLCDPVSLTCKYSTQDCGTSSCDSDSFCCNSNTSTCRTCHNRGCSGGACYNTTYPNVVSTCAAGETCSNGQCTCTNKCTLGAVRCLDASTQQTCITGANGCTDWGSSTNCPYGCSSNACVANNPPTFTSVSASPSYVKAGTTITITGVSSDPEGSQVRIVCGSSSGASDLCTGSYAASNPSCTFTSSWNDNSAHTIYCRVCDNVVPITCSAEKTATITADNTAPSVSVSHLPSTPIVNTGETSSVMITATASDSGSGISSIKIFVDSQEKNSCASSSCTYSYDYAAGNYNYYAIATDAAGNQKTSSGTIVVSECNAQKSCTTINGYTCHYRNAGTWYWDTTLESENACSDGYDNDCNGKTDRLDTGCAVGVTGISLIDTCPLDGEKIDVSCTATAKNLNCIGAWVDYNNNNVRDANEDCTWTDQSYWSGNTAVFAGCSSGSKTNTLCVSDNNGRKVECYVQTDKCSQTGTNQAAIIDVINDPCPNHDNNQNDACTNDIKCKWVIPCGGTNNLKFYGYAESPDGKCLRKSIPITYNCMNGRCSATCDGSGGCTNEFKQENNNCYYNSYCDMTGCSCGFNSVQPCPAAGTRLGGYCYCGTGSCGATGCGLTKVLIPDNQALVCDPENCLVSPNSPLAGGKYELVVKIVLPSATVSDNTIFTGKIVAYVKNKNTNQIEYVCNPSTCSFTTFTIGTTDSTGQKIVKNYISAENWVYSNANNYQTFSTANAPIPALTGISGNMWTFPVSTAKYHSDIDVCMESGGLTGCDKEGYIVQNPYTLEVKINYPDVDNFLVPKTPSGEPKFTMTMPINVFAEAKRIGLLTTICEDTDCTASYGIDDLPKTPMAWNAYEKKFNGTYDTKNLQLSECDKYHLMKIEVYDSVSKILNTTESRFFLSCTPAVTSNPVERRVVLGDGGLTAFSVTIWNPKGAETFTLTMEAQTEDDDIAVGWLSLDCAGQPGCTINGNEATLDVGALSSKTINVILDTAERSGSFNIRFTAKKEDGTTYTTSSHLLVFAESLYEFNIGYLIALFAIAIIIFAYNENKFKIKTKRKI